MIIRVKNLPWGIIRARVYASLRVLDEALSVTMGTVRVRSGAGAKAGNVI